MVNTFLIRVSTKKVSYHETAHLLDKKRLNKQILEAKQMINSIEGAFVISKKLKIPIPEQCKNNTTRVNMKRFIENARWMCQVYQEYKKIPETLFYRDSKYYWSKVAPRVVWKSEKYKVVENAVFFEKTKTAVPRENVCLTEFGDRVYSKNNTFVYHACVKMWVGYLDAFKYYFNCMLEVAKERGIKSMYFPYQLARFPVVKPWWTEHSTPIFMASLMRKELMRNEPVWYDNIFPEIKQTIWFDAGYSWFGNLSIDEIMDIIENGMQIKHTVQKQKAEVLGKRKKLIGVIKVDDWIDIEFDP